MLIYAWISLCGFSFGFFDLPLPVPGCRDEGCEKVYNKLKRR